MNDRLLFAATTIVDGVPVTLQFNSRWRDAFSNQQYWSKPKLYPSFNESVLENLVNRTTRDPKTLGKLVRPALEQAGLDCTVRWSWKAGCSCPCSPGWILTGLGALSGLHTYDGWVTFGGELPAARDDAEARVVQAARLASLANDPTLPLAALAGSAL